MCGRGKEAANKAGGGPAPGRNAAGLLGVLIVVPGCLRLVGQAGRRERDFSSWVKTLLRLMPLLPDKNRQ